MSVVFTETTLVSHASHVLQADFVSDKPVAAFVTFLFVFPLTLVCCVGPTALVASLGAALAWLSQSTALVIISMAIGGVFILLRIIKAIRGVGYAWSTSIPFLARLGRTLVMLIPHGKA